MRAAPTPTLLGAPPPTPPLPPPDLPLPHVPGPAGRGGAGVPDPVPVPVPVPGRATPPRRPSPGLPGLLAPLQAWSSPPGPPPPWAHCPAPPARCTGRPGSLPRDARTRPGTGRSRAWPGSRTSLCILSLGPPPRHLWGGGEGVEGRANAIPQDSGGRDPTRPCLAGTAWPPRACLWDCPSGRPANLPGSFFLLTASPACPLCLCHPSSPLPF